MMHITNAFLFRISLFYFNNKVSLAINNQIQCFRSWMQPCPLAKISAKLIRFV